MQRSTTETEKRVHQKGLGLFVQHFLKPG